MPTSNDFNTVCSQLLTKDDLSITHALFQEVLDSDIVTRIDCKKTPASIKIYATHTLYLSDITPILSNFGFTVIDEVTYTILHEDNTVHINRFNLHLENTQQLEKARENIEQIISDALKGVIYSQCTLFSLVYKQNLSLRQVTLLRAIIEYVNQSIISINHETIIHTINRFDELASLFLHYFFAKFDPAIHKRNSRLKEIEPLIEEEIKNVPDIMDDKILKLVYAMLQSVLRTNYFLPRDAIAFKINTRAFAENLKGLQPNLETFVYHPEFSGIHQRMSLVSRGGLRWSDRHEDYREEVKSLMITQEGKNSIIIPDGAKGGFVIHKPAYEISKEYFTSIYKLFIHNLLDVVDNIVDEKIVRDKNIIAYDDDDSYFVVAADKGTASMSDVANEISCERNYWLGDAFASGGSNGFGHKDLGITAKGALMSSKRFFIEQGINLDEDPVTVVGIGSMSGDVFGNGMLGSKSFKLLAAVSHQDIFIDPDPIPMSAYEERQRLFVAKQGGWRHYNQSLISKGGGVFLRSDKAIELSPEIKKMIGSTKKVMNGEELVKKLLCMKVDLLFNGGVGTYVKSSDESDLDLGDKQNEAVRVNASDLRANVVCEGGNLGFTQKARIEFALGGGKINIDGLDNAAGVDTSDHEVNLKILLHTISDKGLLNEEESQKNLQALTEQVVNMVLWSNYRQSLAISRDEQLSKHYLDDFITTVEILEREVTVFKRRDFYIPKNENIRDIITKEGSIVRPVLCSMLSYAKIFIKNLLLDSKMVDEAFAIQYLYKYFPKSFVGVYEHEILHHPLRREIIATVIADTLINFQGITFISDYNKLGDEKFLVKIKSYLISNHLFGANDIRHEIFRHDYSMPVKKQYELLSEIEHSLNFSARWMVKYLNEYQIDAAHILDYKDQLFKILNQINNTQPRVLIEDNESFNHFFGAIEYLRFAVAVIMIKENTHHSFNDVATIFYLVINEFKILDIISSLDEIEVPTQSDLVLRRQVLQYVEFIVVHYTQKVLAFQRIDESPDKAFANYIANEQEEFEQIKVQITEFMAKDTKDIKEIAITVNLLMASVI